MLKDFDSLLDDRVRLQVPYTLNLEIEPFWNGIVIEGFTFLWGLFPFRILALWPFRLR